MLNNIWLHVSTLTIFSEIVCLKSDECITTFGPVICHFLIYSCVEMIIKAWDISSGRDFKGHLI